MNEKLFDYLESVTDDIDSILEPHSFNDRKELGESFKKFVGYDPTEYWDRKIMTEQMDKLTEADGTLSFDDQEDAVTEALSHYDEIKPNVMLQVAQKTVKHMFNKDISIDDLNLDLEYLMNTEIFGIGYDEDDDEEDEEKGEGFSDEIDDDDESVVCEDCLKKYCFKCDCCNNYVFEENKVYIGSSEREFCEKRNL